MSRNFRFLTLGLWALTLLALAAMIVSGFYYRHQKQLELASTPDVRAASLQTLPAVPSFSLTDQNNQPLTSDDLKGQVWIADFIFTRCQGPCPLLTRKMAQVQKALANTPVKLLTITVDPAYDTPPSSRNTPRASEPTKDNGPWPPPAMRQSSRLWPAPCTSA